MLNRGYAYTTVISSQYHGQPLLAHLASLYPHSTSQAWQQKLNNGEVTLNGVTATGSESVTLGQTLVWNRPPWMEPDAPHHFEVLFEDPHLLAVNKPSGLRLVHPITIHLRLSFGLGLRQWGQSKLFKKFIVFNCRLLDCVLDPFQYVMSRRQVDF